MIDRVALSLLIAIVVASLTYFGLSSVRVVYYSLQRRLRFVALVFSIVTFVVTLLLAVNPLALAIPVMFSAFTYIAAIYAGEGRAREIRSLGILLIAISVLSMVLALAVFRSLAVALVLVPEIIASAMVYNICSEIAKEVSELR